jgi:hypothetical protein
VAARQRNRARSARQHRERRLHDHAEDAAEHARHRGRFLDVDITDVRERVYYGPGAAAALDLVRDMKQPRELLARMRAAAAERALAALREALAAHEPSTGVLFDSRAWLITARRART